MSDPVRAVGHDAGTIAGLGADPAKGLSDAEAERRAAVSGPNELPKRRPRPTWLRLADQLRQPMSLLLLAAATISGLALREWLDAAAISIIVAINAVIAVAQEGRATRALAALEQLSTPEATVVRSGIVRRIPASQLVPGDVVHVEAGDGIPADAVLVGDDRIEVDESMLTGESVPVQKGGGEAAEDRRARQLFWGTYATRGAATAVVVATGPTTELGRIASSVDVPAPPTPLQQELARLSAKLGAAAVVIAALVFGVILLRVGLSAEGLEQSFLAAVALAVAAVPEGLPTVTLVALAAGVRRMAAHGAIVRRLPAVETLGSTSVIVTDKTGTITQNRMTVTAAWAPPGPVLQADKLPPLMATRARCIAALANDATLAPPVGDPMELALLRFAGEELVAAERASNPRVRLFPVDSDRMLMSTVHLGGSGCIVYAKGAPEAVVDRCSLIADAAGRARPFTTSERAGALAAAQQMASRGMRVLALADRPVDQPPDVAEDAERQLTFVGLVGLQDPVRPDAAAVIADSVAAGVQIVMATGDHPSTAVAIGREVGLDTDTPPVTGTDIRTGGLPADPLGTAIYARVEPSQKLALVRSLQARGEVVAMTGDGVNDAPALHSADIGVALGQRGSDVAREASDLVVTDDDLATIVTATREGRGIYDNIRKVVDYLVAGNLSEIGVVIGALILFPDLGVPLLPLQLLWVNLLTDGLPAVALGNDRHDGGLMAHPPRPRTEHLLDGHRLVHLAIRGTIMALACIGTALAAVGLDGADADNTRTIMLTTLVTTHLLYAFLARQPATASLHDPVAVSGWFGSRWLGAAVFGGLSLQLLIVMWPPAQAVFRTSRLAPGDWLLVVAGALSALLVCAIHRRVTGGSGARRARPAQVPSRRRT